MKVPFNRPVAVGRENAYMADALARMHISGDGYYSKLVHLRLEEITGAAKALMTSSCTHALEMTGLLLNIQSGDEIILPSFTFVSTANAFVLRGGRPVFVDIRPDTLNINEKLIEESLTERTRAIVVVHYAGVACNMDAILAIAASHAVPVIEDNAHGLFGRYKGRPLGSFGTFATQSFHETKNVTCGEGGALIINDPAYCERADIIREKGTDRSRFFRGLVDKYSWVEPGSSYLASDLLAAFLYAQLEARDDIQHRRASIWNRYDAELGEWAAAHGITRPTVPADCDQAFHLYYLLLPTARDRDCFMEHMRSRGITTVFHYVPLHTSEYGRSQGYCARRLPISEDVSDRLVRLPFFNNMTFEEQSAVIAAATAFVPYPAVAT